MPVEERGSLTEFAETTRVRGGRVLHRYVQLPKPRMLEFRFMKLRIALALICAVIAVGTVAASSGTAVAQQSNGLLQAINARDTLVFEQESLLNTYRCLFNIDAGQVPGGCQNGKPSQPPNTTPFTGTPTQAEVDLRDTLVFEQESLLNVYRCMFDVDTEITPFGCENGKPRQPPTASAVAAGRHHSCGIKSTGSIACWGLNDVGQANAPAGVFAAVSAGGKHSCALNANSTIACWGDNGSGQANVPAGTFTAISAGGEHSCGLKTDGTITCWGLNNSGQATAPAGTFTAVSAGNSHSCGLRTGGAITCWGHAGSNRTSAPAGAFTAVSAGAGHSCGLKTDGTITCWGYNDSGQATAPAGTFAAVSAGSWHSCGLMTDGTVTCWGNDLQRQADAPTTGTFAAVSAGGEHSCGLKTDGTITCWGKNSNGRATAPAGGYTTGSS